MIASPPPFLFLTLRMTINKCNNLFIFVLFVFYFKNIIRGGKKKTQTNLKSFYVARAYIKMKPLGYTCMHSCYYDTSIIFNDFIAQQIQNNISLTVEDLSNFFPGCMVADLPCMTSNRPFFYVITLLYLNLY